MSKAQKIEPRETRISMRVDPDRKAVIARAAKIKHTTISDFVLENAYQAASNVVAEETSIIMTESQFNYMCKILDNPPKDNVAKMKKLLKTKTIFDA
jgi:uncharacterized protein (DUF1778 family)